MAKTDQITFKKVFMSSNYAMAPYLIFFQKSNVGVMNHCGGVS